jgi:hypothetical protein
MLKTPNYTSKLGDYLGLLTMGIMLKEYQNGTYLAQTMLTGE